jgi:methylated-DNA-[protein]-cysteine S-methyltransferase
MRSEFLLCDTVFLDAPLRLGAYRGQLVLADWTECARHAALLEKLSAAYGAPVFGQQDALLRDALHELGEYERGARTDFDIPFLFTGTSFQKAVCLGLRQVPFGSVLTYAAFAARLSAPRAVRAVAGVLSHNPLSLFLPCHRIVPASGGAGNYRGGALLKQKLLALESARFSFPPLIRKGETETT